MRERPACLHVDCIKAQEKGNVSTVRERRENYSGHFLERLRAGKDNLYYMVLGSNCPLSWNIPSWREAHHESVTSKLKLSKTQEVNTSQISGKSWSLLDMQGSSLSADERRLSELFNSLKVRERAFSFHESPVPGKVFSDMIACVSPCSWTLPQ